MTALDRLQTLYVESLYYKDILPQDLEFAFSCLDSKDPKVVSGAAALLAPQGRDIVLRILQKLKSYPIDVQKLIIFNLMVSTYGDPYWFLITYLEEIENRSFAEFICVCLGKTNYTILPILLSKLNTPNRRYLNDLKTILFRIGFLRLEPLLAMFPVLPHEQILRDVFGDKKIDQLKTG